MQFRQSFCNSHEGWPEPENRAFYLEQGSGRDDGASSQPAVAKVCERRLRQRSGKSGGCQIWRRGQIWQRALKQGVPGGREPVAAAAPGVAAGVGDGGNALVAVGLHDHVRVAALRSASCPA